MNDKLKILWFSNTPAAADETVGNSGSGGWMKALDKAIQNDVELHVAFSSMQHSEPFTVGKTTYHPILIRGNKSIISKIVDTVHVKVDCSYLDVYLDIINRVKPDLIHIHGSEQSFIAIANHTEIPIVYSVQAVLTVMNSKFFDGIGRENANLRDRKSIRSFFVDNYLHMHKQYLAQATLERSQLKYVPYVMGRTDWDRRCMSVLAPQAKYFHSDEVLRDGFYKYEWQPHNRGKKLVLHSTLGGLPFKGLETICDSLNLLNHLGYDISWTVAGVSDTSLINRIVKKKLGKSYPAKGLNLLGSIGEKELIEKLLDADMYIYTSHQDNSPNSICEAQILGVPCVATLAGGVGTLMRDKEDGIILQEGDPYALTGAIIEVANNVDLAVRYGKSARERALKRHDRSRIIENLLTVYQECITK